MNITDAPRILRFLPELVRDTAVFIQWNWTHSLNEDSNYEGEEELDERDMPLSPQEAGRIALEFAMILRSTQGDQETFQRLINEAAPQVDSQQRAVDVIMSLAGMVGVLAEDEDMERFGKIILRHESRSS